MAKIQPVKFPLNQGTATEMSVLILNFETNATTCTTYYELKTDEGKVLSNGNYTLTESEFAAWGTDNEWVAKCVANAIGVTIITY
jgi:predicted secreted protein